MENKEQVICYENSGCIVFINKDADTEYVTVVPASQTFDVDMLDETDRDTFIAVSSELIKNRPPLSLLFDIFVNKKQGFILGAFANEEIIGYIGMDDESMLQMQGQELAVQKSRGKCKSQWLHNAALKL